MKTVFRSEEIAHIWANRGAPMGRSPGNLSFDGDAISSYSTVICRRIHHPKKKDREAYVFDSSSFSVSTSKSQGRIRQALPGSAVVFYVWTGRRNQYLDFTPVQLRDYYLKTAEEVGNALPSRYAHKRAEQYRRVSSLIKEAVKVCEFFDLKHAALDKTLAARQIGEADAADIMKKARELNLKAAEKRAANEIKERTARAVGQANEFLGGKRPESFVDLARLADGALDLLPADLRARFVAAAEAHNADRVARWLQGAPGIELPYSHPVLLRAETPAHEKPEMVTSKGARVPLTDARKTYRFALAARAKGWHKNGETHQIGSYQLDAVNEQGVVAGCHRVSWAEIERFAATQGWKA